MKCIIAQGNAEPRYDGTRHNIGFFIIDHLAEIYSVSWQTKPKFKAEIAETSIAGEKVLLIKPITFYNGTGESARTLKDFYKLDNSDILVIHDELALPFGTLRTRQDGSDAGNNGIKSLNSHIGTDYGRIRIGIASNARGVMGDMDFVLGSFSADERPHLETIAITATEAIKEFVAGSFTHHTIKVLDTK